MAFGAIACWGIFLIAGLLLGGALVFRGAVAISNKCLGNSPQEALDPDDEELDEWIGYRQNRQQAPTIPQPGVGKGMLCMLWLGVVGILTEILMRLVIGVTPFNDRSSSGENKLVVVHVLGIVVGFPFSAWILASILPTRFSRACLVLFWNYAIIALLWGIGSIVFG